jgi:hypothetical protein
VLGRAGYSLALTVVAMEGADGVGASAAASGTSATAAVSLHTLSATSLVFAAGNDWSSAAARRLPTGWVELNQWPDSVTGDTFWSQYTNQPTGRAGSLVKASAGGPANDRWNLAAVELINTGD